MVVMLIVWYQSTADLIVWALTLSRFGLSMEYVHPHGTMYRSPRSFSKVVTIQTCKNSYMPTPLKKSSHDGKIYLDIYVST